LSFNFLQAEYLRSVNVDISADDKLVGVNFFQIDGSCGANWVKLRFAVDPAPEHAFVQEEGEQLFVRLCCKFARRASDEHLQALSVLC